MKPNLPCLLIALASATAVVAQPPGNRRPPPPMNQPPMMPPPFFALLDTDHDGALSKTEVEASSDVLAKADKNNDGEITPDELRPQKPDGRQKPDKKKPDGKQPPNNDNKDKPHGPPPGKFPIPPVIAALDADRDGTISAGELEGATDALKKLDVNQDGELSPQELRPAGLSPRDGGAPPPAEDSQLDGVE